MAFKFFIDTADVDYIKKKWDLLKTVVNPKNLEGITTNPSAFGKENLKTIAEWEARTRALTALVTEMRGDDHGIVYVQVPADDLTEAEVRTWAEKIMAWTDGHTAVALKLPPYKKYLDMAGSLPLPVNITGIADCSTALSCVTRPVVYISMIPGRMGEVGIPAREQLEYVLNAKAEWAEWEMITGSLRTLDGLKWCVEIGTIPTLGKPILDQVTPENVAEVFGASEIPGCRADYSFSPLVTQASTDLSKKFFEQMNGLASQAAAELRALVSGK